MKNLFLLKTDSRYWIYKMGSKVKIKQNGWATEVYVDGKELSKSCTSLKLEISPGNLSKLTLELFVDEVEIDSEIEEIEINNETINSEKINSRC